MEMLSWEHESRPTKSDHLTLWKRQLGYWYGKHGGTILVCPSVLKWELSWWKEVWACPWCRSLLNRPNPLRWNIFLGQCFGSFTTLGGFWSFVPEPVSTNIPLILTKTYSWRMSWYPLGSLSIWDFLCEPVPTNHNLNFLCRLSSSSPDRLQK